MLRTKDTCLTVDIRDAECLSRRDLPWTTGAIRTAVADKHSTQFGGILCGRYRSRVLGISDFDHVEICIFDNPQIMNALVWTVPKREATGIDGMVYRNYRAKFFRCDEKTGFIDLPTNTRLLVHKGIVGQGEVAESVLDPLTFNRVHRA
jgi:hypothetical protein